MFFLIVLFCFVFVYIAFLSSYLPVGSDLNSLYSFYFTVTHYVGNHILFFIFAFFILVFLIFRYHFDKDWLLLRNYVLLPFKLLLSMGFGFFVAYFLLFVIAFIQVNIFALYMNVDPNLVGMQTSTSDIVRKLGSNTRIDTKILHGQEKHKMLSVMARVMSGSDNYYGKYALSSISDDFIMAVKKDIPHLFFLDNTFVIADISVADIEKYSPYIGYVMVKKYFPDRVIKSYPKVNVMDRVDYDTYRKGYVVERLNNLDKKIEENEALIASMSASLEAEEEVVPPGDVRLLVLERYIKETEFFKSQRRRGENLAENIHRELGLFEPPNKIKIVIDTEKGKNMPTIDDYFEAFSHEYLHYASFISSERSFKSSFFEEGLTEYFARASVKDTLSINSNYGYPLHVAIIDQMLKLIPESEMTEIYFGKDDEGLRQAMNRVYGDDFYEDNLVLFDDLQYASNFEDALKYANMIMKRIGGKKLEAKTYLSGTGDV